MSYEDTITITCIQCKSYVPLYLHKLEHTSPYVIQCHCCNKLYGIEPGTVSRQILLFIDLCRQLKKSEEILSSASVAIQAGPHEVQVPFKILLTRLRSTLDLNIGGNKVTISYRVEPIKMAQSIDAAKSEEMTQFSSSLYFSK